MPVVDQAYDRVLTFDSWARESAEDTGVDPNTRLAQDPVGATFDFVFGDPSTDEMVDWMGS
jgi:hypothetical protein